MFDSLQSVQFLARLWTDLIQPHTAAARTGLEIVLVAILAYAALRLISRAIARFERHLGVSPSPNALEHAKRARTLSALIANTSRIVVMAVATVMILDKVGVNIMPILATASIVGLAFGFGAQTLVKDVIAGFFLIFENQIRVGDAADIDGIQGIVETIHLRTVVVRDLQGAVHVIPCGSIAKLSNQTKDFAYALVDAPVSNRNPVDTVIAAAQSAGNELCSDETWAGAILGESEVLGVETMNEHTYSVRMRLRTVPHRQWEVARELRRRLKSAFEKANIELSAPASTTTGKKN
jgi:small conductance mechanosensitive channel